MSKCTNCPRIENDICLSGQDCIHFNQDNIKAEIIRRKLSKAEHYEKQAARLRKEAGALTHDNH